MRSLSQRFLALCRLWWLALALGLIWAPASANTPPAPTSTQTSTQTPSQASTQTPKASAQTAAAAAPAQEAEAEPVEPAPGTGFVESAQIATGPGGLTLTLTGWVVSQRPHVFVTYLRVWLDGQPVYAGRLGMTHTRDDVARVTGQPQWRDSGFVLPIRLPVWRDWPAGSASLRVEVMFGDGTRLNLNDAQGQPLRVELPAIAQPSLRARLMLAAAVLLPLLVLAWPAASSATSSVRRWQKNIFASAVCLSFALLVAGGWSGSSLAMLLERAPVEHDMRSYLGQPQMARSDEWLVVTPLAISQTTQPKPFSATNPLHGLDGQNMNVVGMTGAPIANLAALARPATWGFFVFDLRRALAWNWWLPYFLCFGALWVLLQRWFDTPWRAAALLSATFTFSAYSVSFSGWPAYLTGFALTALLAADSLWRHRARRKPVAHLAPVHSLEQRLRQRAQAQPPEKMQESVHANVHENVDANVHENAPATAHSSSQQAAQAQAHTELLDKSHLGSLIDSIDKIIDQRHPQPLAQTNVQVGAQNGMQTGPQTEARRAPSALPHFGNDQPLLPAAGLGLLLGWACAGFALVLYPGWQIALAYLLAPLALAWFWLQRQRLRWASAQWLGLMIAVLVAQALLGSWWLDGQNAIETLRASVYPGQRSTEVGGYADPWALTKGLGNFATLFQSSFWSIPSDAGSFIYVLGPLLVATALIYTPAGRAALRLPAATLEARHIVLPLLIWAYIVFVLLFIFSGLPAWFSQLSLWGRVPAIRLDVALGLAQTLLLAWWIGMHTQPPVRPAAKQATPTSSAVPESPESPVWLYSLSLLTGLAFALWVWWQHSLMPAPTQDWQPPGTLLFIVALAGLLGALLIGRHWKVGVALYVIWSLVGALPFNPIAQAPSQLRVAAPLSDWLSGAESQSQVRPRVAVVGNNTWANALSATGVPVLNTTFYDPPLAFWRRLDPQGTHAAQYNRYQHLSIFLAEPKSLPAGSTWRVTAPALDRVELQVDARNMDFSTLGVAYVLAPPKDAALLRENPKLELRTNTQDWYLFSVERSE